MNNGKSHFDTKPVKVWGLVLLVSIIFKIVSWPGANILILISAAGLTAYAISGSIWLKGKHFFNNLLSVGGVIWLCVLFYGAYCEGPWRHWICSIYS